MPLVNTLRLRRLRPLRGHVEQVHEEIIAQGTRLVGEDTVCSLSGIGVQGSHAANQNRRFRNSQGQQVCPIDEHFRRRPGITFTEVVAKPVRSQFEHSKRFHIRLFLRGIGAARCERDLDVVSGLLCSLLNGGRATQDNHIGERDLLST